MLNRYLRQRVALVCALLSFAGLAIGDVPKLFPVKVNIGGASKSGYIDDTGRIAIEAQFNDVAFFWGEMARVGSRSTTVGGLGSTSFGLIDRLGNWVLRPSHDRLFLSGMRNTLWALNNDEWRLIELDGSDLLGRSFQRVSGFAEGKAVVSADDRTIVIDEQGTELFSLSERGFVTSFPASYSEGLLIAIAGQPAAGLRTIVFLDGEGEVAIPARTYLAGGINPFSQGYAALQEPAPGMIGGGDAFFIDRDGKRAFGGQVWRGVKSFSEGLAAVSTLSASPSQHRPARWGFIDRNGEMVIEDIYWDVEPFSEGLAAVAVELDSLVPGSRDGLWGAIDQNGVMVIEPQFRSPFRFRDGLAQLFEPYEIHSIAGVELSGPIRGTTMRYIDRNGRTVWDERDHRPVD
ncbi:MAG: WG repeat-containing protein [Spirochaetaceae bacterium]|nr:MAG: WG repeat-containing protein [Spirochaetaceae bacterium]